MKNNVVLAISFAVVFLSVMSGIIFAPREVAVSASEPAVLSPGIFIVAEQNGMAKAGLRGEKLTLGGDDFARALNVSSIDSITFTSVPPVTDGRLFVGNVALSKGQTVSGSNLSLLSFGADRSALAETSFCFSPDGAPYEIECTLYFLDGVNYAPTVSIAPAVSLEVNTYENVIHRGKLSAYDPDGDECFFEIVSEPRRGVLVLSDDGSGEYTYLPNDGYVGKDSFCYVARDKYGNYSAAAEVSVSVSRAAMAERFDDMADSDAHAAAINLLERGIMSGTQIGDGYYFQPAKSVSRSEFVVLAMQTLGIREVNTLRVTDFADDRDIPASMKGYVAAAYELGYINGSFRDGKLCFLPNEPITRAEAAVIVGRMLEAATPVIKPQFDDREDIPTWAESSLSALASVGVLETVGGDIRPLELMSRADTAKLLSAMIKVAE